MTIKAMVLSLGGALIGWISVMIGVMYFTDAAPAAVVIFPSDRFLSDVGAVSILSASAVSITLQSDAPEFAKTLYANGAWIVLPAGLVGCLPLPGSKPRTK